MIRKSWRLLLLILLGAALSFIACGKKGDPLPPDRAIPAGAEELSAQKVPGGILLRWHMPERGNDIHRVRILRREIGVTGSDCTGCNETQVLLDLYSDDPLLVREGGRTFHYLDATPVLESTYGYRVVLCNVSGYCAEASQEATTGKEVDKE